jgi:terminal uridylyltransferase
MILHYLINIVQPPVLPNLQLQPIPENTNDDEIHHAEGGYIYNIWFSKDTESMPHSRNKSSLGELLRGFFDYYLYKFGWGQSVISIRTEGGLLSKQDKGWIAAKSRPANTADGSETWEVKDRYVTMRQRLNQQVTHYDCSYLFALEDPFETAHNVGRTCNGPGMHHDDDSFLAFAPG